MIDPLPSCNICREHVLGILRSLGKWRSGEEKAFWSSKQITCKFHLVSADTFQSCDDDEMFWKISGFIPFKV